MPSSLPPLPPCSPSARCRDCGDPLCSLRVFARQKSSSEFSAKKKQLQRFPQSRQTWVKPRAHEPPIPIPSTPFPANAVSPPLGSVRPVRRPPTQVGAAFGGQTQPAPLFCNRRRRPRPCKRLPTQRWLPWPQRVLCRPALQRPDRRKQARRGAGPLRIVFSRMRLPGRLLRADVHHPAPGHWHGWTRGELDAVPLTPGFTEAQRKREPFSPVSRPKRATVWRVQEEDGSPGPILPCVTEARRWSANCRESRRRVGCSPAEGPSPPCPHLSPGHRQGCWCRCLRRSRLRPVPSSP